MLITAVVAKVVLMAQPLPLDYSNSNEIIESAKYRQQNTVIESAKSIYMKKARQDTFPPGLIFFRS